MFNGVASVASLIREVASLRAEVKALRNEQVKKERDMEDLLHNLDYENVPVFNSKNFKVDADGNMECGNAKIRGSSTICSDITPGAEDEVAMAIGPEIEFDMGENKTVSGTKMRVTDNEDVLGGPTYTRGVAFVSSIDRNIGSETRKTIHGGVVSDPRLAGAFMSDDARHTMRPDYDQAFVGLERPALENDGIRAILKVGDHALWLDAFGVLHTTASEIVFNDVL